MDLPSNIVIEKLPGPIRGKTPALYFRDEVIWSPCRKHFALAYTICEASMCNEVGCMLWGRPSGQYAEVQQNITQVVACCWQSPWCRWLAEDVFVFKAQRYNGKAICVPLVVAHVTAGFAIIPASNDANLWLDQVQTYAGLSWVPWDERSLVKMVESAQ